MSLSAQKYEDRVIPKLWGFNSLKGFNPSVHSDRMGWRGRRRRAQDLGDDLLHWLRPALGDEADGQKPNKRPQKDIVVKPTFSSLLLLASICGEEEEKERYTIMVASKGMS